MAATLGNPCGLTSRRRYRWSAGRVVDYWDESFPADAAETAAAADEPEPEVARLKGSAARVFAVEAAVAFYAERPRPGS